MIYSLTPFFDELDVLEVRLAELDSVVDRFIIAEAPVTHSGEAKPLHLAQNWDRFLHWHDKMTYVVVDDMPVGQEVREEPRKLTEACDSDHWLREKHQRRALLRGLEGIGLDEEDALLLSDLDEIPRADVIADAAAGVRRHPDKVFVPYLAMHVYRLRWRWHEATIPIARVFAPELLWAHDGDLEAVRLDPGERLGGLDDPLGWHLAYMGDIPTKLRAVASRELDTPRARERAQVAVSFGYDIFDRDERRAYYCPDLLMPPYVMANQAHFWHIL